MEEVNPSKSLFPYRRKNKVGWAFLFTLSAFNLVRMRNLAMEMETLMTPLRHLGDGSQPVLPRSPPYYLILSSQKWSV
jgi:hypothetical protein